MTARHRFALLIPALAFLSSPLHADPRFTERRFVSNEIVTLNGKPGIESAVAFAPDERIENIAVGNSATWDVNPNKKANVVFVKPTKAGARTNMTVITDQRVYLFDLISSGAGGAVYMMRFTYPDTPKPLPAAAMPAKAVAEAPPPQPKPAPAELNFAWRGAGEKALLPLSYFDDGASTFLRFASDMALPAILVRGPGGSEGPVNYTVKGDYIVVEGVPPQLLLRSGKQVATLTPVRRPAVRQTWTVTAERPPFQNDGRFSEK